MQLQQRVSILTKEVQSSAAGTAQSLDACNQKEGLINQLSERIIQLEANNESLQASVFNLKSQLEQNEKKFASDLGDLDNKNRLAKQKITELEEEIEAMQNSIGDQEVLTEMIRLRQTQQAGAGVFNIASNDEEPDEEDNQQSPFLSERGRPRTREPRQQDSGAGLQGTEG